MQHQRTGVLVVRVWTEGPETAFRARITGTEDILGAAWSTRVVGSAAEVVAVVDGWLEDFVERDGRRVHGVTEK